MKTKISLFTYACTGCDKCESVCNDNAIKIASYL